jgi:hypothetical protein
MKLSVNRQERTGPFGGKFYETSIQLSVSYEEKDAIRKQRCLNTAILGERDPENPEARFSFRICKKWMVTVEDLILGITAKASDESELAYLGQFEGLVKERCKQLKARIEDYATAKTAFQGSDSSYEEEL